jgi:hypothetical protein
MKGAHLRRTPLRSRHEFLIFLFGLCLFGIGVGILTADAKPDGRASSITPESTITTTTMINSSAIVPETTTTVEPTTTTSRPDIRVDKNRGQLRVRPDQSTQVPDINADTTTTSEAPKTPLEVALKYFGQTGPWADGGFYCAKAVSYFAEEAKVPGFISRDGPSALYADAVADGRLTQDPIIGGMIFIDLFGPDGIGHGQVTHVGIVEYVDGDTIGIIQGNGERDPSVVTRTTYEIGDGFVIAFAEFGATS